MHMDRFKNIPGCNRRETAAEESQVIINIQDDILKLHTLGHLDRILFKR